MIMGEKAIRTDKAKGGMCFGSDRVVAAAICLPGSAAFSSCGYYSLIPYTRHAPHFLILFLRSLFLFSWIFIELGLHACP